MSLCAFQNLPQFPVVLMTKGFVFELETIQMFFSINDNFFNDPFVHYYYFRFNYFCKTYFISMQARITDYLQCALPSLIEKIIIP